MFSKTFSRHKTMFLIAPCGLVIGLLLAFLLSGGYLARLFSWEEQSPRIYQVGATIGQGALAASPLPLAEVLSQEFAGEVLAVTRTFPERPMVGRHEGRVFTESGIYRADAGFFRVFDHVFQHGDASLALEAPFSVVMTESCAQRYFGREARIGQQLTIDHQPYVLTGIIKDLPAYDPLQFEMLLSLSSVTALEHTQSWSWNIVDTYLKLDPEACAHHLRERLPEVVEKYARPQLGEAFDTWLRKGGQPRYFLRAV